MTQHSYVTCNACGDGDPYDRDQRDKFTSVQPYFKQSDGSMRHQLMHFCNTCFVAFTNEMVRILQARAKAAAGVTDPPAEQAPGT